MSPATTMSSVETVIAFDLYGTLLSTESIATELAKHYEDDKAKDIAALWRKYQLEYTWRLSSIGLYRSFSDCTKGALQHAVSEAGLSISPSQVDELMEAYNSLETFPEVVKALKFAIDNSVKACIFSNGTDKMVRASVATSPDLKPYANLFQEIITVEGVKAFKPTKDVYAHLLRTMGKANDPKGIWVVSANPFDVVGAKTVGLRSAWVDRTGTGWVDKLGDIIGGLKPDVVADGLDEAVSEIIQLSKTET